MTGPGGTVPQSALFDAARRIAAGELDVAAIVGAEAMKSRDLARRHDARTQWHEQGSDVAVAPVAFEVPDALSDEERAAGLALPVHTYALFEHALRRSRGSARGEHVATLDALSARQRAVAARNDDAWLGARATSGSVTVPSASNRDGLVPVHEAAHVQRRR